MIIAFVVGSEVGFWVVLAAGLITRYLLGMRLLSAVLLAGIPLLDLILLIASFTDLRADAKAGPEHGLAAVYVGFSVVFGPSLVRWADERFAYRWKGGRPPRRPPTSGKAYVRYEWREFGKACLAWFISCGLLLALIAFVGHRSKTDPLWGWIGFMSVTLAIWAIWPISASFRPNANRTDSPRDREPEHREPE